MPRRSGFALVLLVAAAAASACARTTTIVLVRHAERSPTTAADPDPELTDVGRARAAQLAEVARDAGVTEIIVSDARRTQQTAAPLAAALGLTPIVMPVAPSAEAHAGAIAAHIGGRTGRTILVVGHSNTVPLIIQALGFSPPPAIDDEEHGLLFVVLKRERGETRLIRAHYGS